MALMATVDLNNLYVFRKACTNARQKILDLKRPQLTRTEIVQMIYQEMVALGEPAVNVEAHLYNSQLDALRVIDEQRVELLRARTEIEELRAERCQTENLQEKESTPLEANLEKLFMDWEQHKKETAMRFEGLDKKGNQKTIDDDQLKMAMQKIKKLEKEILNLKDQTTSNFFELQHKDKKIAEQQREIQELTAALDDSEAELQVHYQKMSILQKDLKDSESSCRELLKSHERVVQDLKDQKEKDDEQIRDLLKIQEGNATRIEELLKRNRLVRSGAASRVQALKDTVAKQDREIAELEKLAHPWK